MSIGIKCKIYRLFHGLNLKFTTIVKVIQLFQYSLPIAHQIPVAFQRQIKIIRSFKANKRLQCVIIDTIQNQTDCIEFQTCQTQILNQYFFRFGSVSELEADLFQSLRQEIK